MDRRIFRWRTVAWTVPLGCAALLAAQGAAGETVPASPLFADETPLELTITGPLTSVMRDKDPDPEYRPATLRLTGDSGIDRALEIELRPRGHSRRDKKVCTFPPLRLNLPKKDVADTVFEGQDKLKLVTHCKDRSRRNEQFLLQEYLIYRIFNTLTDDSFRARLVDVEYIDTDGKRKPVRAPGFLIEDQAELARRRGFGVADVKRIKAAELEPAATARLAVFQYLIGNTDWEATAGPEGEGCCHNIVLFLDSGGRYVPVPYDFDSTGVIDPPYAAPHESLTIRNVRTRLYRGYCLPEPHLADALELTRSRKGAIYDLFRRQPGLDNKTVTRSLGYLDDYYEVLDDPRRLDEKIRQACRE